MKFKLFGGLDCPDWFLAALGTVSNITTEAVAVFSQAAFSKVMGRDVDWVEIEATADSASLSKDGVRQVLGCLHEVVVNAGRFDLPPSALTHELTMLGIPQDSSNIIADLVSSSKDALRSRLAARLPREDTVLESQFRVDFVARSSNPNAAPQPVVQLQLLVGDGLNQTPPRTEALELSADQFRTLHAELMEAHEIMAKHT
eukprot:Sspe_Gene.83577::Locus_54819_Transcript_1_1_Confidence_1.000_Length_704::g.83577::m.83577